MRIASRTSLPLDAHSLTALLRAADTSNMADNGGGRFQEKAKEADVRTSNIIAAKGECCLHGCCRLLGRAAPRWLVFLAAIPGAAPQPWRARVSAHYQPIPKAIRYYIVSFLLCRTWLLARTS